MINLSDLTISKARMMLDNGELTSFDLCSAVLDKISKKNSELNAFLGVYDDVLDQAREADKKIIQNGELGIKNPDLLGIPIALKDNMLVQGKHAGAGSKIFEGYVAPYDSTVTKKLKEVGAILIGNANMDEFAMGSTGRNSGYVPGKNPLDTTRVPGGSSSGSAVAVAANLTLGSFGTDTGGSVRMPASFCGICSLKPTYGAVSRYGIIAMGSSLDQVGPFGKTVEDCEMLFNAVTGYDMHDATSITEENRLATKNEVKKIGVPKNLLALPGIDSDVLEAFSNSVEKLKSLGYEIIDIELPNVEHSLAVYYIIMAAEASTNLACFDGIRYGNRQDGENLDDLYFKTKGNGFGPEVQRRMLLGAYSLSAGYYDAFYGKACRVRDLIRFEYEEVMKQVDVIIMPTAISEAFKFDAVSDPASEYAQDIFTVSANLLGVPVLAMPMGLGDEGMPLGIQFYGPWFGESLLFEIGKKFESKI